MAEPPAARAALRPWLLWSGKLALTALITWLALRKVPMQGLRPAFAAMRWNGAGLALGFYILGLALTEPARLLYAGRLVAEPQPAFRNWLTIYAESRPFFYILPAAVGAESMVWMRLRQLDWGHPACGFVVLATRTWGMSAWSLVVAVTMAHGLVAPALLAGLPAVMRGPAGWAAAAGVVAAGSILAPGIVAGRWRLPLARHKARAAAGILATTLLSVAVNGIAVQLASRAAGTPLSLEQSLGFIALFNFAMVIPVSLGGVGLQEALILFLFLPLGYPPQKLLAFSALLHAQRLVFCGLGLGVFLGGRRPASAGV